MICKEGSSFTALSRKRDNKMSEIATLALRPKKKTDFLNKHNFYTKLFLVINHRQPFPCMIFSTYPLSFFFFLYL